MPAQVADERFQVVRELLVCQQGREHAFAVRRLIHDLGRRLNCLARIADRLLQIVRGFLRRSHGRAGLVDHAVNFLRRFRQRRRRLVQMFDARLQILACWPAKVPVDSSA